MDDFIQLKELLAEVDPVAANSSLGSGEAGRVRNCRAAARRILEALEGDGRVLEKAAVQVAWTRVLTRLVNAGPDEDIGDIVSSIQKLSGLRGRGGKAAKGAKVGVGKKSTPALRQETLETIEGVLRLL